jgi:glucan 1,3-beta-glucosidase
MMPFLFPRQQTMLLLLATTITMMIASVGTGVAATATQSIVNANGNSVTLPKGGTQYPHFIAMNDTMTCVEDNHATPFNNQVRGVNLGGWMVLEPWITPSLFYQFLGRTNESEIAIDTYTFCKVLGPKEANKQLRRHWKTWITEDIIERLAKSGINSLRLPLGDYMYKSYGPYVDGCFDGALDYVDAVLDW